MLLVENCLHQVKTKNNGSTVDYRILQDKSIRYLSLTAKPHDTDSASILGAIIDITERKEHEQELEKITIEQSLTIKELDENERKYRLLFERSIDPIFLASGNLVMLDMNHAFLRLFGYNTSMNGTIPIENIFSQPEDYRYFMKTMNENAQIRDYEVSLMTSGGIPKICLVNCVFIPDQAAEFYTYQGIVRDLSLRKQAETDMLLAERLSLTGKIARTIAHEVRNPLTNLTLALDQLRSEIPVTNESAAIYTGIIERNVSRIEQLMTEMLNSSRPKQLHLRLTQVSELLSDTFKQALDRMQLSSIVLHNTSENDIPRILIDKEKIQIALLNIIINAVEAMEPGKGVLTINTALKDDTVTISIHDNGKGIPQEDLNKLFDPFFTAKKSGMGLGLTSVKNILNSHSANIEVKSEPGVGTTFYIHFKLAA
jgi:PAS domain S-box-containing protein